MERARRRSTAKASADAAASLKANAENIAAKIHVRSKSAPKRGRPTGVVDTVPRKRRGADSNYTGAVRLGTLSPPTTLILSLPTDCLGR
jgi:hypothetical protein